MIRSISEHVAAASRADLSLAAGALSLALLLLFGCQESPPSSPSGLSKPIASEPSAPPSSGTPASQTPSSETPTSDTQVAAETSTATDKPSSEEDPPSPFDADAEVKDDAPDQAAGDRDGESNVEGDAHEDLASADTVSQLIEGDEASVGGPTESAAAENHPERVLLLTSQGPLIFDLTIWIDDLPYRQLMDQTIDEVLQLADEDDDGRVTWDELTASRQFIYGQFGNMMINTERQRQDVIRRFDINQNQRVDRNEVPGFLVQNAGTSRIFRLESLDLDEESVSEIFQWLDVDEDRRLSESERTAAGVRLRLLDSNDDDTLMPDELSMRQAADMPAQSRRRQYTQESAVLLGDYTDWSSLLFLLEERYGFGNRLVPSDFDLLGAPLRELDVDQDDQVDIDEINGIAEIPPHFAVTYGFGSNSDRSIKGIRLDEIREELKSTVRQSTRGDVTNLNLQHIEVALSTNNRGDASQRNALEEVWKQADGDENGYLDETEYQRVASRLNNVPFAGLDENQDERVVREEADAFLRRRDSALRGRLQATAGVQPDSLLAYLDQDNDQRLTSRELRSLPERLSNLDENQDGMVNAAEIPRAMTIRIDQGIATPQDAPRLAGPVAIQSVDEDAPLWFVNMDGNRDGELSVKEFLGTDELFRRLDQDGDGFIDADEVAKDE